MNTARHLARFAITSRPDPAVEAVAAPAILDCIACILAGVDSPAASRSRAALAPLGSGPVPVLGTGLTLSAPTAALVNAVAGHAWDMDDWEEPGNTHPTVVLFPALLAAAHLRPVTGAELLAAYVVGIEVIMRLGQALTLDHYKRGFHATATLGAIGAAAAVARLLGLSEDQAEHALALSVSQAVGYTAQFGSTAKPLQAGFAARTGVEAALLARAGATARPHVLDDKRGFAGLLAPHDAARLAAIPDRLGAPWGLLHYGLAFKPWPSCGYTHRLMTAAAEIRDRLNGETAGIVAIRASLPDFHHAILPFHQPRNQAEALFSAPASIARMLVSGGLTLADGAAGFWTEPEIRRLIALTVLVPEPARDPSLNFDPEQPDRLQVTLSDGLELSASCAYPLGAPQNPMPPDRLAAKWHEITGRPVSQYRAMLRWPQAADIATFLRQEAG
ncbi:MmgE/PrpD family protein [Ruegeria pomeroyi]|nr:MmgE/PrpD family protein [Ruegeria pomeroyi]